MTRFSPRKLLLPNISFLKICKLSEICLYLNRVSSYCVVDSFRMIRQINSELKTKTRRPSRLKTITNVTCVVIGLTQIGLDCETSTMRTGITKSASLIHAKLKPCILKWALRNSFVAVLSTEILHRLSSFILCCGRISRRDFCDDFCRSLAHVTPTKGRFHYPSSRPEFTGRELTGRELVP